MEPAEYRQKLSDAISELEANGPQAGAAYNFLNSLRSDPHRLAVRAFLPTLQSESSDLRTVAAFALGRFGRGNKEVFEALTAAYKKEEDRFFTASAILHGIGQLQTPAAARFLVDLLKDAVSSNTEQSEINAIRSAIKGLGIAVIQELKEIHQIIASSHKIEAHLREDLRSLYGSICSQVAQLYERFRNDGYSHIKGDFLEYRDLHAAPLEKFGNITVIADQRVEFLAIPRNVSGVDLDEVPERYRQEIRIVVLEKSNQEYFAIAVADCMTKPSLSNTLEDFGRAATQSLIQSGLKTNNLNLGIFRPTGTTKPFIGFTLETKNGFPSVGNFSYDKDFDGWCGRASGQVREYLTRPPSITVDLQEYAQATIQDERIGQSFKSQLAASPTGRIDYSDLFSEFSQQVQAVREGRLALPAKKSVFADSFDHEKDGEFFGATMPEEIQRHLLQCDHIAEVSAQSEINQQAIVWPSPLELPPEFFRSEVRPHELGAPSGDFASLLDLDPRVHGVVLLVATGESGELWRITNVPRTVYNIGIGYSWGYSGSGPHELALNILNYFVPPNSDGLPEHELQTPYWGAKRRTFASETAVKLSSRFRDEFIETMPHHGGILSPDRIRQWILSEVEKGKKR